jgi:outer membrane receptor protein involved in Fe transport
VAEYAFAAGHQAAWARAHATELRTRKWSVSFFVNNLFNQKYIKDAGNTGDNLGIPTFIAGEPRLFGADITIKTH